LIFSIKATIQKSDFILGGWHSKGMGIFRFWRDSGYAIGAVITCITADQLGISAF
jgi:hypothetical protein